MAFFLTYIKNAGNSLNNEECDDFSNHENYFVINEIKNVYIKKDAKKSSNDYEYDYYCMNNNEYPYIAVKKANTLLEKYSSNHDGDRFFLNFFCIFKIDEILKKHEMFCKDYDNTKIFKKY